MASDDSIVSTLALDLAEAIIVTVAVKTVSFRDCELVVRRHSGEASLAGTMIARLVKRE